jgi:hypothetical protein
MLDKTFFGQIVDEFNNTIKKTKNVENTFDDFINFFRHNHNLSDSVIFEEGTQLIIAGYENSYPQIVARDHKGKMREGRGGRMIHSFPEFAKFVHGTQSTNGTCDEIAPLLEAAIYNYATFKSDYRFGGPLHIIKINPNNSQTIIKSFEPNKFKNYRDMAEAIINNKIEVNYLFPFSEELLKRTLQEGIELGY